MHGIAAIKPLEKRWFFSALAISDAQPREVNALSDFVVTGYFNSDSRLDMAISSYDAATIKILLGRKDGGFDDGSLIQLAHPPDHIATADVNGDSLPDLVAVSGEDQFATVLINNGQASFTPVSYPIGQGCRAATLADLNSDGRADIVLARYQGKSVSVLYNDGTGGFGSPVDYPLSFTPVDLVAGYFNADDKIDLAAADYFTDSVHILLNQGNGSLSELGASAQVNQGPAAIATRNFNGDSNSDLVTANFLDGTLSVLLGNGDGTFQSPITLTAGRGATFVTPGDLDNDGKIDLISVNANDDTLSIFRGKGDGTFEDPVTRSTGASPRSAVAGQLNGDGLSDIVVTNQAQTAISIFSSDLESPKVTLLSSDSATCAGAQPFNFKMQVADNAVVADESLGTGDVMVSGPNGFSAPAQLIDISGTGTSVTANFRIAAPGGFWDPSDNGEYTFSIGGGAIFDSAGNAAAAGTIGKVTITARDAGNSFDTAMNLGSLSPGKVKTLDDSISPGDRYDFFRFALKKPARVYGRLMQLADDADLQLFNAAHTRLAYAKHSGTVDEAFDLNLAAGTYYVRVIFGRGTTGSAYRLRIQVDSPTPPPSNDRTLKTAKNLGLLVRGQPITFSDYVGKDDSLDLVRFRIDAPASVQLKLSGLSDNANLALLDSKGLLIASSSKSGKSNEQITRSLSSGWYYARLTFKGTRYTFYTLRLARA